MGPGSKNLGMDSCRLPGATALADARGFGAIAPEPVRIT
jgi:hypothetical protein